MAKMTTPPLRMLPVLVLVLVLVVISSVAVVVVDAKSCGKLYRNAERFGTAESDPLAACPPSQRCQLSMVAWDLAIPMMKCTKAGSRKSCSVAVDQQSCDFNGSDPEGGENGCSWLPEERNGRGACRRKQRANAAAAAADVEGDVASPPAPPAASGGGGAGPPAVTVGGNAANDRRKDRCPDVLDKIECMGPNPRTDHCEWRTNGGRPRCRVKKNKGNPKQLRHRRRYQRQ